MLNRIKKPLVTVLSNMPGWKTPRKLVIFESDDWGSIRMKDRASYNFLLSKGIKVDKCPFNRYDSLAGKDDIEALFSVLKSFRDSKNRHPVITANCVTANPDFEKIRRDNFTSYYYEPFTETLQKYYSGAGVFELWKEGIKENIFRPQFHGREHLNTYRWMNALRNNYRETRLAFDLGIYGISTHISGESRGSYLAAFDMEQNGNALSVVADGIQLFNRLFGYSPYSFIAPNYVWSDTIEEELAKGGVKIIQGRRVQIYPGKNKSRKVYHYTGQKNRYKQVYTVRNCMFEPSIDPSADHVDRCLSDISLAFKWHKPAIIETHRVNYIGSIDRANRDNGLKKLKNLIAGIKKHWPEAEFLSTEDLGKILTEDE